MIEVVVGNEYGVDVRNPGSHGLHPEVWTDVDQQIYSVGFDETRTTEAFVAGIG